MAVLELFGTYNWKQFFASNVGINSITWSFILTMLLVVAYWYLSIPSGIPPGPMGLPLLGYLPFIGDKPYLELIELGKKYGSVVSFYLGSRLVVVLNDYNAIREALVVQADNFAGRPIGYNMNFFRSSKNTKSIAMTDGSYWEDHRGFITKYFKTCGMGKSAIEPQITDEIQSFIAVVKSYNGSPTNFTDVVGMSVLNNIAILTFGKRFEYDDPWFQSVRLINNRILENTSLNFMMGFPWLSYIPMLDRYASRHMRKGLDKIRVMTHKLQEDGRDKINEERPSYISAFQDEKQNRQKDASSFDNEALVQNIRTLMSAGTETVANTLLWAITYLMLHPDVQTKAQLEVDEIIGIDRVPTFSDRLRTPYLAATISEIQRMRTIVPINLPHRNREETTLFGYLIPKSTYILSNLYAAQMDPEYWTDPEEFRPERFLDKDGSVKKHAQFVVFSLGKRRCMGEPLARMELYLYMATMLQHVTLKLPPNHKLDTDGMLGVTLQPKHVVTCAVPRKQGKSTDFSGNKV